MTASKRKTIAHAEFEARLDANNERLRQDLEAARERVQRLERRVARKESSVQRLTQILTEIEREEEP